MEPSEAGGALASALTESEIAQRAPRTAPPIDWPVRVFQLTVGLILLVWWAGLVAAIVWVSSALP